MTHIFILLILLFISYLISAAIHELGHGFFVKYTNNRIIEMRVGTGKKDKYLFKIGDLQIKRMFFLPGSRCVWKFRKWDNYKKDGVLISLGGCIANFITIITTLPIGITCELINLNWVACFFFLIASVSGYQLFLNLLPIKGYDGYKIIRYNRSSKELIMKQQKSFESKYKTEK